jgi:hypothetical protein
VAIVKGILVRIFAVTLGAAAAAGCAHPVHALHGRTAVVSGRGTAHDSLDGATRKVLVEAAAITLDHGYRYFEVTEPIHPGVDVTIQVYGAREIDPRAAGVYDAIAITAGQVPAALPPPQDPEQ